MHTHASAYEAYIGRWSRAVAREFVARLSVPPNAAWLDVACGTGALTQAILASEQPARVDACDLAAERIEYARRVINDPRASFTVASASSLTFGSHEFDAVVSGLPFPSLPEPRAVLAELRRLAKRRGTVAFYVWDFEGAMQMLHYFWSAATALDPNADEEDSDERFTICKPERLKAAMQETGFRDVDVSPIDVPTTFRNFEEFWRPFLSGRSPAQQHVQSLGEEQREALRDRLEATLPAGADGVIALTARAWSAKGRVPR